MYFTQEEEEILADIPPTLWSQGPTDVGLVKGASPVIIRPKTEHLPRIKQYPLKPDAMLGIQPVIEDLLRAGVLIPCPDSPVNTPIFPVKKAAPSTGWRMVQDLVAVNNAVIQRSPCVADPHTLLNSLDPKAKFFTVVDISNAFFSVPVHKDSQFWFAFTFKGKRYTYTRLPQGYCESPTIYSDVINSSLSTFDPPKNSQILTYVDDILVASESKEDCQQDTLALLKHLAQEGHKVSKSKLQFCKENVKYLGHQLSAGGRTILEERKTAILQAPKPQTKKQMMSFLGLTNYCRSWVPNYAELTAPLNSLMYKQELKMSDNLRWTEEAETSLCNLKQAMVSSSTLALPDYSKDFVQMVDCKGHFMTSVLTQMHGNKLRPVAYYSTKLDAVACALPHCVRAVVAASLAVTSSAEIVLFHPLILRVPHAVSALLLQTKMTFLSPARHLSCMSILLSQPHLKIERCTVLNPATLVPTDEDGLTHDCQALSEQAAKSRADLKDTPLKTGSVIFVDGSSKKDDLGVTKTGYAVVTHDKILKAAALPSHYSAQAAELVALTEACKLMRDKEATIYTDSQYAFATTHTFAQHWKNRGMITSTGKPVTHAKLLTDLLQAVQLPKSLAICKCAAHTSGTDLVTKGNAFADKVAKEAAFKLVALCHMDSQTLDGSILADMQQQSPTGEINVWLRNGATLKDKIYT